MCHGAIVQAAAPYSSCSSARFKQLLLHTTQWLCEEDGVFWLLAGCLILLHMSCSILKYELCLGLRVASCMATPDMLPCSCTAAKSAKCLVQMLLTGPFPDCHACLHKAHVYGARWKRMRNLVDHTFRTCKSCLTVRLSCTSAGASMLRCVSCSLPF